MFNTHGNKFLKRTYTIRFCITPHYDSVYGWTQIAPNELSHVIKIFCDKKDILIEKIFFVNFDDFVIAQTINHPFKIPASDFIQIHGTKNDFHLLYDFLLNYEKDNYIALFTTRR